MTDTFWGITQEIGTTLAILVAFVAFLARTRMTQRTWARLLATALWLLGIAQAAGLIDGVLAGRDWPHFVFPIIGITIVIATLIWIDRLNKRAAQQTADEARDVDAQT